MKVRDLMTPDPATVTERTTVFEAANVMKQYDIGDVLVLAGDSIVGIVTDRDIVIRAVADGRHPSGTHVEEICTHDVVTIGPEETIGNAIRLMRDHAIRRLIVVENEKPIGMLSLGDLAAELDPDSLLGQLSAAEPNA